MLGKQILCGLLYLLSPLSIPKFYQSNIYSNAIGDALTLHALVIVPMHEAKAWWLGPLGGDDNLNNFKFQQFNFKYFQN
jgi:hypothetical protein